MEAFALTGRNYHLYIIPRALPWARSFCPFRAYGANPLNRAYGANPLNRAYGAPLNRAYGANPLNVKFMNTLALTFAVCSIVVLAFLAWLFTPWGKKWSKEL